MSAGIFTIKHNQTIKPKQVALPVEHGAWGFLFEPLVAGIIVAPSIAAPWIAMLMIGAFLMRRPVQILIANWQAGRHLPHTMLPLKFAAVYGAVLLSGFFGSLAFTKLENLAPFILVIPAVIYQIHSLAARQTREFFAEVRGAIAVSASAAVLALAAGWDFPKAMALWAIFIARFIPSIIYVRDRLKLEKGKQYSKLAPAVSHLLAFGALGALAYINLIPILPVLMMGILLYRALFGMSPNRKRMRAMQIGIWEVIYGVLMVAAVAVGYYSDLKF